MLFVTHHLAERSVKTVGQKHWVVSETLFTARRPHEASRNLTGKLFEMSIGPSDAQCGYEMGRALSGREGRARSFASTSSMAFWKFRSGPAQRAE